MVSLRLVPRNWKLPHAADRSLLSWQGMHKSVIYSGALPCCTSNIIVHGLYWMRLETGTLPATSSRPSSVSANANVDTLPASDQLLEQALVTVEGSVVVSTLSASTVQSFSSISSMCA